MASSLHAASNMLWNHIFLSTESTGGSTTEGEEVVEDLCRWLNFILNLSWMICFLSVRPRETLLRMRALVKVP